MRNRIHRDIIPTRLYYCLLTGSYHFVITLTSFPAASTISRSSCLKHFILDANKSSFYTVRFHLNNKKKREVEEWNLFRNSNLYFQTSPLESLSDGNNSINTVFCGAT